MGLIKFGVLVVHAAVPSDPDWPDVLLQDKAIIVGTRILTEGMAVLYVTKRPGNIQVTDSLLQDPEVVAMLDMLGYYHVGSNPFTPAQRYALGRGRWLLAKVLGYGD